jgi:hypothetical protein
MVSQKNNMQVNAKPVGLVVRFAPCWSEFEPSWRWIYWPEEAQFICALKKSPRRPHVKAQV